MENIKAWVGASSLVAGLVTALFWIFTIRADLDAYILRDEQQVEDCERERRQLREDIRQLNAKIDRIFELIYRDNYRSEAGVLVCQKTCIDVLQPFGDKKI